MNTLLADDLEEIALYYTLASDSFRAKTYERASTAIRQYPTVIESGTQATNNIKGIGKSVAQDIDYFLELGYIPRLQTLQNDHLDKKAILDLFISIYGIGPVTAARFYQAGYRTIEDLWNHADLTEAQRLGIIWRFHISQRIPRTEMRIIEDTLGLYLHNYKWNIAGSYRRGEATSGDIDLLIAQTPGLTLNQIVQQLQPLIVATLALGPTKFMGMLRLSDQYNAHRLDIRLIDENYYAYALMYFTGSQRFNILMRARAIELGLRLNEYSLHDSSTYYPAANEEEIFQHLGVRYLAPDARTRTLEHLIFI